MCDYHHMAHGKHRLPAPIRHAIEYALTHALVDREGSTCAVDQDAQRAMRIYLDTWVAGPLRDVLEWDCGKLAANRYIWSCASVPTHTCERNRRS